MMSNVGHPLLDSEVDGYHIRSILGRGGMGVVFKAEDMALSRTVALKMIEPSLARDEAFLRRFRAEARALARIDSPYIVRVHALRQIEAGLFIVMECVEGGTLSDRLAKGRLPWKEALTLFRQMLLAFEHAHGVGVIHRDIKPGNIMLTPDGDVKVTDFGLAKFYQQSNETTRTQGISGTLSYMSPEQMKGAAMDARTDLWSLGVVLYEMLCDEKPFRGDSEVSRMQAVINEPPAPLPTLDPAPPKAVVDLVFRSLEKNPDRRFQSAAEMREIVDAVLADQPARTISGSLHTATRGAAIAGVAVAVVLLAGILAYVFWPTSLPDDGPTASPSLSTLFLTTDPPGAGVFRGGYRIGTSPISGFLLPPGQQNLTIEMDGYMSIDTLLQAAGGDSVFLSVALSAAERIAGRSDGSSRSSGTTTSARDRQTSNGNEGRQSPPAQASISVSALPEGSVTIDDVPINGTATVDVGRRRVRCQRGTALVDTFVTVAANESVDLSCFFEADVNIQANEEDGTDTWASITINGEATGEVTGRHVLGPGTYRIGVRREGFETLDEEQVLTIRPSFHRSVHQLVFRIRSVGPT